MKRHCICALALALLTLAAIVPVPSAADEPQLIAALNALQGHVEGTVPLSDTQIANHKSTIDANKGIFGNSSATITASFDLFQQAYDSAHGEGAFVAMVASVPEPASFHLLLLAAMGLSVLRKSKRA